MMKKIFLLLVGITCFGFVAAQNSNMIIVVPRQFSDCLNDFINYKRNTNINCQIVSIDTNKSTAEIKTSIFQTYTSTPALYLLLIGDDGFIPSFPVEEGCTDANYAIFEEDSIPCMAVGRFPCETREELLTMLEKSMSVSNNRRFGAIASNIRSERTNRTDCERLREMYAPLFALGFQLQAELFDGSQDGYDSIGNPTQHQVAHLINQGCEMLLYAGHGDYEAWQTSGFSAADIHNLTNTVFPIVLSAACLNGNFVNRTCFAETWLRSPQGAKAAIMSSIFNDWDANLESLSAAFDSLHDKSTIGNLWLQTFAYTSVILHRNKEAKTWILFGDPSMPLFYTPNAITETENNKHLSLYPNPTTDMVYLNIQADNFNRQEISVFDTNGKLLKKQSVSDNHIPINISDFTNGIYYLTIDKHCLKIIKQ